MILQDVTSRFIPPVVCRRWVNSAALCWGKLLNGKLLIYQHECDVEWGLVSFSLCSVDVKVSEETSKKHFFTQDIKSEYFRFSFRWSISRLVTAATVELMCKRSQTVCGGCSRIKVRGISLIWRTDCTDERCMVKAALAESRCGCWQQSVGLRGRRVSERGCCYKFSRGSESVAQFVDGRWPDLCAGVLLLGSHQDSPCSA